MRSNKFCPNLNDPEAKALIQQLGLSGFYREYIKNNYEIPTNIDEDISDQSVAEKLFVNRDLFTANQQAEVVDSFVYQIQQQRLSGVNNVKTIYNNLLSDFTETKDYFLSDEFNDDLTYNQIGTNLSNIIDNFSQFFDRANQVLNSQGIVVEDNNVNQANDEVESNYDSTEALFQKLNYSDESNFSQSSKDTASANLKIALSLIPKYIYQNGEVVRDEEGDAETELNFINLPTFESLDNIWNDLLYSLLDIPIGSKLDYLANSDNPRHRVIYDTIVSNPRTNIQNEFESVFSKQQAKFITIKFSRADKSGKKSILVFDTNRLNANNLLIDDWYNDFLGSDVVSTGFDGEKRINTDLGKNLLSEYNTILSLLKTDRPDALKRTKSLLNKIGVSISQKALESNGIRENRQLVTVDDIIRNRLKYLFNRLAGATSEEGQLFESELEKNNPFIDETSSLETLAKLENQINPSTFEASFVSGDGKAKYSFVNNTYLSHKIRDLKTDESYLKRLKSTGYASESYYLNQLLNNPTFKEVFDVYYVDSLGNSSVNQTNKTFKRMNTKEKEISRIGLFQNAGKGTTNKSTDIGYFIGLIPSDKTTLPIFKALKVDVKTSADLRFNKDTIDVIYDQFISEYNRVKQTFIEINDPSIRKISEYHTGAQLGRRFVVFPFLNSTLIRDNQLLELDDIRLAELVRPKLEKFLVDLTRDQIQYWTDLGIYNHSIFDKSYLAKNGYSGTNGLQSFAANYAINQFIFMMNQTQLFSGDPALHGKSVWEDKDKGIVEETKSINKTWVNFYKRMAKDIAPGLDGNFSSDNFNTIFLKDLNYSSDHLMEYMEKVDASIGEAYGKINPADAQEYTTLAEHIEVMEAYGRLTPEMREAADRLIAGENNLNDVRLILQPVKPVYVQGQIEGAINQMYYIKTSSFPLIPALTKGLEIDKLRLAMENNVDSKGNRNPIGRAVYESGVKLGLQGILNNVSNDGGVNFNTLDINPDQVINLTRSGFRIQQELPYHGDHTTINEGSQGRKLILNNLDSSEVITYNNKQYTGREAKDIFEKLHTEKMDRAFNKALTDLGFNTETGQLEDISKIADILKQEAESRNYPINDIYSIQVINENGKKRFKVPLSFTNSATRFESILNSIITNRVINSELPGFTAVQGANPGFSKVITDTELQSSIAANSIVWVDPNDTKLNYITESNGRLVSADILVPSYFKGVNIQDYIVGGYLDFNRLPEELLTVIGLRIPTQGYNSIMKFRVKGFLPQIVGDLAVVPSEITVQMGSDFDVDKLFIYRYNYKIDKKGNISKITTELPDNATEIDYSDLSVEQIDNLIIQMFEDRLSDPKILDQILEPNGFGKLPEVASIVSKLTNTGSATHTFSTRDQNNIHTLNNDGKAGTGIFSLFSTFFKASQDAGISLVTPYQFKDINNRVHELTDLSSINNIEGNKRSNVIMYLQSASVDNSKEQILGKLNINDNTMGVAGTLAMMGMPEDFIGYFLSQPSIIEYVNKVNNASDIVTGAFDPAISNKTIEELIGRYSRGMSTTQLSPLLNNITYGSRELLAYLQDNQNISLPSTLTEEEARVIGSVNDLLQLKVISDFSRLKELVDNIQVLQSATNIDTKGLGTSFTAIEAKAQQIESVFRSINMKSYPLLGVDRLFQDNVIGKSTDVLIKTREAFNQFLPYGSATYNSITDSILQNTGLAPTEANLKDIYSNLKSYILSSPQFFNLDDISGIRDSLLYGENNIAERWKKYSKSPEGKKNILTKRIKAKVARNRSDYNGLEALNSPASNNAVDINSSIMYFYDMINSSNSVERTLAEDIVKYYVLTGAQYGPRSIGKYISFDVLEQYNFSKKLRDIQDLLTQANVFDTFIDQYFQNNPFKAVTYEYDGKITETMSVPISGSNLYNTDNQLVDYFVIYDKNTSTPFLYKKDNVGLTHAFFTQIPILGNEFIKRYNYVETSEELAAAPQKIIEELATRASNDITVLDQSPRDRIDTRYNLDSNDTSTILNNIVELSSNEYFRKIANDLLKNANNLSNVDIKVSTQRPVNGWYDSTDNSLNLNLDVIASRSNNLYNKFEEVFLHELLHAGTVYALNNPESLSRPEQIAVNRINSLYNEYRKSFNDQDRLAKYESINNRRLSGETITTEEYNFLRDNKSEIYPLINVREFVAAGLTSPDFVTTLKNNNFWTRLRDFISRLFGVNATDLDALYSSTLDLISNTTDTVEDGSVDEDLATTEDNRIAFVSQRDEFLSKHKSSIGKVYTDASQARLIESSKKDKYDRLKVWFWNGELRVSRVDPNIDEDIADAPKEEDKTARLINSYIDRVKDSLKRFEARKKQLGTEVNPELDIKIANLESKLKELESKRSIRATMEAAEDKLKDISSNLANLNDVSNLYDALTYIEILKYMNESIEFTEEFDEYNQRLNNISATATKLYRRVKIKAGELLTKSLKNKLDIDYNVATNLNKGVNEIGFGEANYLDFSQSSSTDIQAIGYLIDEAKFNANQQHDDFIRDFAPIISEYRAKYGNKFDQFLQKDSKGKPTGYLLNKYSQEFYDKSNKNFKFYNSNTNINMTEAGKTRFEDDRKIAFENSTEQEYVQWLLDNDPNEFIKDWKNGKSPRAQGARRYLTITPKDQWIDSSYTSLKNKGDEDAAVKLYNFIEPIFRRNNSRYKQQSNYIPEIQKGFLEQVIDGKANKAFSNMWEEFNDNFNKNLYTNKNDIDILTGEPRLHVPVLMFNNRLDPEDKSYDLAQVAEAVAYQEFTLKYKYESEPLLNLYYSILKDSKQFLRYDEDGVPVTVDKSAPRLLEQSSFLIQNYLYNKTREDSEAENKYGPMTDRLISYVRLKGMGWNPFSALGNITQGLTSNFTFSTGSQYFGQKDYFKATGLVLHTIAGKTSEAKKISKLFQKFDTFVKSNELNFGKSRELTQATRTGFSKLADPFEMQQRGEYFIQGQTMVATLLHEKITDKDGNQVSLYDAFDSNGNWITDKFGEDPYKDPKKLFKMTMKLRKAIIDVHGNYSRPMLAKKHFYQRAAMIFRTWLPQAINNRFGEETSDILLGTTTKGRYRSYNSFIRDNEGKINLQAIRDNLTWLVGLGNKSELTQLDKSNMRKNLAELGMIAALSLAIMGIKAMIKDLDDDEKYYANYIINSMSRAYGDLTFFMSPASFDQVIKDPIPLIGVVRDITDLLPAAFGVITGDDEYKSGPRKGKSKLGKEVTDLMPGITQIDKNMTYMKQVFED